jgi:hypothetical protein
MKVSVREIEFEEYVHITSIVKLNSCYVEFFWAYKNPGRTLHVRYFICLQVSGDHSGYAPANDVTNLSVSHNGSGGSGRGLTRASDGTSYGAV